MSQIKIPKHSNYIDYLNSRQRTEVIEHAVFLKGSFSLDEIYDVGEDELEICLYFQAGKLQQITCINVNLAQKHINFETWEVSILKDKNGIIYIHLD